MKKKKPNGQQFKCQMNKLSKNTQKVDAIPKNIKDSWESPDYNQRYVPGEHFNNWIDYRS